VFDVFFKLGSLEKILKKYVGMDINENRSVEMT